jgi:DNA-binding response OmpR family regulator
LKTPASPWKITRTRTRAPNDPARILVAEDDPEMRRLVVETLRRDGYEVHEANDGGKLLVHLAQGNRANYDHVDLIVSDIRMPVCTGLQIVEALRNVRCEVPIILMTAFGDEETRALAERLGAVLFDKPFEMDDLRIAVIAMLGGT